MMSRGIPYPHTDEVPDARRDESLAEAARRSLDPSDVLGEVQRRLISITDDHEHPLWPLIRTCTRSGTEQETGVVPHVSAYVGVALLPIIDEAISALVREALDAGATWEG